MPRARMLKFEFFDDPDLAALPPHDRLAYQGLWCLADRAGRLRDEPARIRARIFPYEIGIDMDGILARLSTHWLRRYVGSDGLRYIAVVNLHRHQHFHCREMASRLPGPDESGAVEIAPEIAKPSADTRPASGEHSASTPDTDTDTDTDTDKEQEHVSAGADTRSSGVNDGFDAFWTTYPNHAAKADALKAWRKLKPSGALQAIILAAVTDQKTWRQWREGVVPHAATWLRHSRWDDERPADDRRSSVNHVPMNGTPWCDHDPPCHTQQEHTARVLADERARREAVPA